VNGGFGGNIGHDPGVVTTLYALLVLSMLDELEGVDLEKTAKFVASL